VGDVHQAGRVSLGPEYFEGLYERRDDPWRLAERWYERRKRALTIAALPRERFTSGLEIGCSIGTLTAELAPRCDRLLATDIAERPVQLARERLASATGVEFAVADATEAWPSGRFDLVVLSEVAYYLDEPALTRLARACAASLAPDGVVVACHWRHPVDNYPLGGDAAHEILVRESGLGVAAEYLDPDFRLQVLARAGFESVASREGLIG